MSNLIFTFEDASEYLCHYGVKGMKWGVRRYQNTDRTLTAKGKRHEQLRRKANNTMKTSKDANSIVRSLSSHERYLLGADNGDWIRPSTERQQSKNIARRTVVKDPKTGKAVNFVEVWDNQGKTGQIAVATRSGSRYRGKGYASEGVEKTIDWYNRYGSKKLNSLEWVARNGNVASINLAKKYGFEEVPARHDQEYSVYVYKGRQAVPKVLKH